MRRRAKYGEIKSILLSAKKERITIQEVFRRNPWICRGGLYKSLSYYGIKLKSEANKAKYGSAKEAVFDAHSKGIPLATYVKSCRFSYATLFSISRRLNIKMENQWVYRRRLKQLTGVKTCEVQKR